MYLGVFGDFEDLYGCMFVVVGGCVVGIECVVVVVDGVVDFGGECY